MKDKEVVAVIAIVECMQECFDFIYAMKKEAESKGVLLTPPPRSMIDAMNNVAGSLMELGPSLGNPARGTTLRPDTGLN